MGISSLLPALKSVTVGKHVSEYQGKKVAIDAYGWLHKGGYKCSRELCLGEERGVRTLVEYMINRSLMIRRAGVEPVLVFDGARLPMKAEEEERRRRNRQESLERARVHEEEGNFKGAFDQYARALDISTDMAAEVIAECRRNEIEFIVAPYEADAQMAHMATSGYVYAVITEDSDLIPYQCPRILFKMDNNGYGQEIEYAKLPLAKEIQLADFTPRMILEMCIMGGCDYLPAIKGIGIKKANAFMKKFRSFDRVCKFLRHDGFTVPADYEQRFRYALWTFQHQHVIDFSSKQLLHVRPIGAPGCLEGLPPPEEREFLGPTLSEEEARGIALGLICPMTKEPFQLKLGEQEETQGGKGKGREEKEEFR